ncbi:hypothetical protein F0562_004789 [Nyssa sinensis]|uniref:Protein kinase domain-containing protein n=1 Tax=Nyssa sinensis TaxID=561372 RepID=A0A5J5AHM3_9ASTE|nr:hypothetical protein F0562_004789 [Nyssa sinensis]
MSVTSCFKLMNYTLVKMGYCLCFGRKKEMKLRSDDDRERKPSLIPTVSNLSEVNAVGSKTNRGPSVELPVSTDVSQANNARTFTYRELATATNNFREESFIGEGGFGPVHKGKIESTGEVVAVKGLDKTGFQGDKEFLVEILMLSLLHHPNLVNLIGYCAEGDKRLLVYEFMPLGSLEYHLHDLTPDMIPLDWNTRMKIAVGAANGLDFLHNQADPPVIYRDLKSSNILLGEGFHPKLSDFGLAKFGPAEERSHISTRVMGTQGYCAPEYAGTGRLTMRSDIFSFGVVLLELITGRRALDSSRGSGKHSLVDWARPMLKDRKNLVQLADPHLKGQFLEPVFCKAVEVASMCLRESPSSRPAMSDVVLALNYLTSQQYDPNATKENYAVGERDRRISARGQINESRLDFEGSENTPKETRMLNKGLERERAVAEAKMWGEAWRDKRRQSSKSDDDNLNR